MLICAIVASGLYYLSELVEEHTVFAKKLLYRLIYGVVGVQLLLLIVDRFPIGLSALSVVSHGIYAQNLRRFPIVKLSDPLFLLSCGTHTPFVMGRPLNQVLTVCSPCNCEPLLLVPIFQRSASELLVLCIPLLPRHQYSNLYRDRILLRPLCLACAIRFVCLAFCRRECSTLNGL